MAEKTQQPQKHRFNQEEDTACINEWRRLLVVFKSVAELDTPPKNGDDIISKLKEDVRVNGIITQRQVEGLVARCDNYLNRTYGKTKTAANMSHSKTN